MFEYFGDLGGLFEIVQLLAYFLTAGVIKRLYYAAMVANTFSIQHHDKDKSQYYHSQAKKGKLTSESDSDSEKDKDDSMSKSSHNSA